jgi:hypothetical protein
MSTTYDTTGLPRTFAPIKPVGFFERFGSWADLDQCNREARSTTMSGHRQTSRSGPKSANCDHRCPLEVKQFTERLIEACYIAGTVSACQQWGRPQ